ncbi:3-oxo-tetronate kinase [Lachnospiraceae bacterium 54-53]
MHKILIGCVADDFTGASDLASFLEEAGAKCLLINGLPDNSTMLADDYDAVVIALKTRSVLPNDAVSQSLEAFSWLSDQNPRMLYFKYCSTFDSTPAGNIGPVLDSLMERYQLPYTILCPSLPVNERTVKNGILYVSGVPLGESPMKNHPVNPMWDSFIPALMKPQSSYPSYVIEEGLLADEKELHKKIKEWKRAGNHFYLVPDYIDDEQGMEIAEFFRDLVLASGGSALPPHFYRVMREHDFDKGAGVRRTLPDDSRVLILSGSCSEATGKQIRNYISRGNAAVYLSAQKLLTGEQTLEDVWKEILTQKGDLLVHSYNENEPQADIEQEKISAVLENAVAELGKRAIDHGIKNLIVAGGETSGAVIQRLRVKSFEIGPSIAPGVPILYPTGMPGVQIALKSGNFGDDEFLNKGIIIMKKGK